MKNLNQHVVTYIANLNDLDAILNGVLRYENRVTIKGVDYTITSIQSVTVLSSNKFLVIFNIR